MSLLLLFDSAVIVANGETASVDITTLSVSINNSTLDRNIYCNLSSSVVQLENQTFFLIPQVLVDLHVKKGSVFKSTDVVLELFPTMFVLSSYDCNVSIGGVDLVVVSPKTKLINTTVMELQATNTTITLGNTDKTLMLPKTDTQLEYINSNAAILLTLTGINTKRTTMTMDTLHKLPILEYKYAL